MKKILIAMLIGITMVGCQNKKDEVITNNNATTTTNSESIVQGKEEFIISFCDNYRSLNDYFGEIIEKANEHDTNYDPNTNYSLIFYQYSSDIKDYAYSDTEIYSLSDRNQKEILKTYNQIVNNISIMCKYFSKGIENNDKNDIEEAIEYLNYVLNDMDNLNVMLDGYSK